MKAAVPENSQITGKTIPGSYTRRVNPEKTEEIQEERARGKRGRKPATESRAAEIRTKLLAWRQTPEPQRLSLRALATEIGTSHQLLSFHLRGLDKWQMKDYQRKAREITARASAENRLMTSQEQQQCVALGRASLDSLLESAGAQNIRDLREVLKLGNLSGIQVRIAKLLASKGDREAQEILDVHFQPKNNLPVSVSGRAKSFRIA
jgi:hypothetical protein